MNDYMKNQIKTMIVSVQTFQNGIRISALEDDGTIDKDEEKIIKKAQKASEQYEKEFRKLIGE